MEYIGKTKMVLKHLGFLEKKYGLIFVFQSFDDYNGFYGPIDTYSFYNDFGCFTLHNIVQKGEWGLFVSKEFSTDQYQLLNTEINQKVYFRKYLLFSSFLKDIAKVIVNQISLNKNFFGIKVIG